MKFQSLLAASAAVLALSIPACVQAQEQDPVAVFEYVWKLFDTDYAIFTPKGIDWDALYRVYRPRVTESTSEGELFDIVAEMLGHLNDNHTAISGAGKRFGAGILNGLEMVDFDRELVRGKYLGGKFEQRSPGDFTFGWVKEGIGYFHFSGFGNIEGTEAIIDEIVEQFKGAKGIVIDVRANGGGDDMVGKAIADRFADAPRLYLKTQLKRGTGHDDFYPLHFFYVVPGGPRQFIGPVVLLQHRHSVSAADNFALAMRVLPHVASVGDFTSGCYADAYGDTLPNGWRVRLPNTLFVDQNDFCWEGIGVPPDYRVINTREDIAAGRDRALDFAIALIEAGGHVGNEAPGSLVERKVCLVDRFIAVAAERGREAAVAEYHRLKSENPDGVYVSPYMFLRRAPEVMQGDSDTALAFVGLCLEEFPDLQLAYYHQARLLLDKGDRDGAAAAYRKVLEMQPRFPWDRTAHDAAKAFLEEGK